MLLDLSWIRLGLVVLGWVWLFEPVVFCHLDALYFFLW
jgi:hypothetical protein